MTNNTEFIWTEKFRPTTIQECILPSQVKKTFLDFLAQGEVPNLLLFGPPGMGKTTVAKALCTELGVDSYMINGSDEGRFLDTIRTNVNTFASTVSLDSNSKHKVVFIDEADNTGSDVQLLLKANIERTSKSCRYIFTCNSKNKIIPAIQSRCLPVDFAVSQKDRIEMSAKFFERIVNILNTEKVKFEPKVVAELVNKYFPDYRSILNQCQKYSAGGNIDSGILAYATDLKVDSIVGYIKAKNFTEVRKWVCDNNDGDSSATLRKIYDALTLVLDGPSVAAAVLLVAKYQYQAGFVADQEINLLAALTEIMIECNFK
jgi:DNA polymerase III delta prime subunit